MAVVRRDWWHWPEAAYGPRWSWEDVLVCQVRPGDVVLGREALGRQNRGMVKSVSHYKQNDGTSFGKITVMFRARRVGEGFRPRDVVRVRSPRVTHGVLVDYGWGDSPPTERK